MLIEKPFRQTELSTETLMEEVQSVVLETDKLESEEIYMHMKTLDFSANQASVEKKFKVSHLKTIQKMKTCRLTFDEEMQPVALAKN